MYTLNYYDSYTVHLANNKDSTIFKNTNLKYSALPVSYQRDTSFAAGKPTVGFVYCNGVMLASATYYDVYGRVIQTRAQNHIANGFDYYTNQYKGLTANISKTVHEQLTAFISGTLKEESNYTYDAAGRPLTYTYQFGTGLIRTFTFTYNTLGKLLSKKIQDATYPVLQTVDYTYNIRGWLTKINDPATVSANGDLFGMELLYNTRNESLQNTVAYNGNISGSVWQTVQPTGNNSGIKAYKYSYDKLNRLLQGVFTENWVVNNKYSEFTDVSAFVSGATPYDLNGNIKFMRRYGLRSPNTYTTIDELTYSYDGNKLKAVDDAVNTNNGGDFCDNGKKYTATPEYTYDYNGNLTQDLNKGILSITYNTLNLPISVNKTTGNRVEYVYDAAGTKCRQLYYSSGNPTKTTDFVGNFVYENYVPVSVLYPEGRVVLNSTGTAYCNEAYIKDQLGNVRVACYYAPPAIKIRQVNSYYPFGMNIKELSANSTDPYKPNEYLYNGKMMQDEMGLNLLDYGARMYDAVLGRWHSIDPLAEVNRRWSPYRYAYDNPMRFIDPDGMLEMSMEQLNAFFGETAVQNTFEWIHGTDLFEDKDKDKDQNKTAEEKKPKGVKSDKKDNPETTVKEEEKDDKNPAGNILKAGLTAAGVLSLDPVPGDEVIVAAATLITAAVAWTGYEIYQFAHKKNVRPSTENDHENGEARAKQDKGGSKGEKFTKGPRPPGVKGPWPRKTK